MKKTDKIFAIAVDTSGRKGSVVLGQSDKIIKKTSFSGMIRQSAELCSNLKNFINNAGITPSDIRHVYITKGPGSYTGLRIAATMAKMFALANHTGIVAISTMDVLAQNADLYLERNPDHKGPLATILDAKRACFFAAVFEKKDDNWIKILPDTMTSPQRLLEQLKKIDSTINILGEGLVYYKNMFKTDYTRIVPEQYWYPDTSKLYFIAQKAALQGDFADPKTLVPEYLREPDAIEKAKRADLSGST